MTNQEILEKAIQKAIDNSWDGKYIGGKLNVIDYDGRQHTMLWDESEKPWEVVIFTHDFAKALWGEEELYNSVHEAGTSGFSRNANQMFAVVKKIGWKRHLQQMVVAEDAIRYLGEHL